MTRRSAARTLATGFVAILAVACSSPDEQPSVEDSKLLRANHSADHEEVTLTWRAHPGATGYQVHRAPIAGDSYQFTLLLELAASETSFVDRERDTGSVVYKVVARGAQPFDYPLAAKLVLPFARLAPIAVDLETADVASALESIAPYDSVVDANTRDVLSPESSVRAGMVLEVSDARGDRLVLTGTVPEQSPTELAARQPNLIAVPLTTQPIVLDDLRIAGITSTSLVFSDGNNQQMTGRSAWLPGTILALGLDRTTRLDLSRGEVVQQPPEALARTTKPVYAGSPDDGTKVVVLYDAGYQTKLYKCWKNGKSGDWDGVTDNVTGADNVKNAAVVRRGRVMYVKDEAGTTASTTVTVWAPSRPGATRQAASWTTSYDSGKGAAAITIPADAPVGDYQVQLGSNRQNYVTVYVIFDPAALKSKYSLTDAEWKAWVYQDDDWQTLDEKKNYLNYVYQGPGYPVGSSYGESIYGYRGAWTSESGANGGVFGQRWVEMAMSIHGDATTSPLQAALHGYQIIGQRITWRAGQGFYGWNSGPKYNTFDDVLIGDIMGPDGVMHRPTELDVVTAEKAALGDGWVDRFPPSYMLDGGQCFNYATSLAAMYRAMGIPGRAQHTIGGSGWSASFHAWAEACLDQPEIHPTQSGWWKGCWYKTDANDPYASTSIAHDEGGVLPVVLAGYADYLINEYKNCEGAGYGGGFYQNYFKCAQSTNNPGTHTAAPIKAGTSSPAETSGDYPLTASYQQSSSAWALSNLFVPYNGPATPSGKSFILDSHHGYALNDKMYKDVGVGYVANSSSEDDIPELADNASQRGLVAGWGTMLYRVPVAGRSTITVKLIEGADKVEILATKDRNLYTTNGRWDINADFKSDASGTLTANTSGAQQLYLWIQLKGLSNTTPGYKTTVCCGTSGSFYKGQQIGWFTVRVGAGSSDTTAPTAQLTAPAAGATVSGTVTLSADASDNVGVTKVEIYVDNNLVGTDTSSPYSVSWSSTQVGNGAHTAYAKAFDAAGNAGSSASVSFTVDNQSSGDTEAPVTAITAPTSGATVTGSVALAATASDNVGVTKVELLIDGQVIATDTTSPYQASWDTTAVANGTHTVAAKAYDAAGNVGSSETVSVTVQNGGGGCTAQTQLLANPGFESGRTGWWGFSITNSTSRPARTGSWYAWLGQYHGWTDRLSQSVSIPASACSATLALWLRITTQEPADAAYDKFRVIVRDSSGAAQILGSYSNLDASTGYVERSFDLSAYKGKTVTLQLEAVTDAAASTSFLVDDTSLVVTH